MPLGSFIYAFNFQKYTISCTIPTFNIKNEITTIRLKIENYMKLTGLKITLTNNFLLFHEFQVFFDFLSIKGPDTVCFVQATVIGRDFLSRERLSERWGSQVHRSALRQLNLHASHAKSMINAPPK